ncbi:MAG: cadherin-like domain-containing protein, partial [Pirellulales bacterium]
MLKRFRRIPQSNRLSAHHRRRLGSVESLEQRLVLAAPVAVDDSFDVQEDNALAVIPFALNANFNAAAGANIVPPGATWQYLDKIQNENGLNQTYPTDGSGRAWNNPSFDVATSTAAIGGWLSAPTPLQAGGITGFPGAPNVLAGLVPPSGPNLVSTYLFRREITVSAAQAAEVTATAHVLCDDGCIGYLNGVEVFRVNMNPNTWVPSGPLTTNTLTGAFSTSDEITYSDIPINLSGANWHAGTNVLTVEVHQADPSSSDVGFDAAMTLGASGTDGFAYADDVFGTTRGDLASGTLDVAGGFTGGGVTVRLNQGGGGGQNRASSGGWSRAFNVPGSGTAQLSVRYRLRQGGGHDNGEFGEAVLTIDGVRYGTALNSSLIHREGGTPGGYDSGWQLATFDVPLTAGNHMVLLGAYNTSGGGFTQDEWSQIYYDDVSITFSGGATGVLDNDTDADSDPLTASVVPGSGPQHGTLNFNADGSFVYTPAANYYGPDSFQYVANDGTANSNVATVSITVASVNDPPLATAKSYNVAEDNVLSVASAEGLLLGATDVDNVPGDFSAVLLLAPANGMVSVNPDGSFTYTPNLDFYGLDTFRFAVSDGVDNSNDATVSIQVSPVNDAPRGAADNYTVVENTTLVADRLTASNSEILLPRGSVWRYLDTGSDQGTAWRAAGYDDSAWVQEDNPNNLGAEYGYGDSGQENRPERTVVGFGADPNQKYITTYFRTFFDVADANAVTSLTIQLVRDDGAAVFLNGVEILRDNLAPGASFSTLAGPATIGQNDEFTFFTFAVPRDSLVTGQNLLAVEIHQQDPTSSDISFDLELEATVIDSSTALLVNDFDPENDPLSAVLLQDVAHGVLSLNSNGTFTYTPNENYQGPDSFLYAATDGQAQSDPVTVTITVTPGPNDRPVAVADAYAVDEDVVLTVSDPAAGVLANDTDGEMDPLTASVFAQPAHGAVAMNDNGTFTYTPSADYFGTDTFTYRAWDGSDYSQPGTVTITVNPIPDAPRAVNDRYFVVPGSSLVVGVALGVLANDRDPDGQS